jgi:hypothetical protein
MQIADIETSLPLPILNAGAVAPTLASLPESDRVSIPETYSYPRHRLLWYISYVRLRKMRLTVQM